MDFSAAAIFNPSSSLAVVAATIKHSAIPKQTKNNNLKIPSSINKTVEPTKTKGENASNLAWMLAASDQSQPH